MTTLFTTRLLVFGLLALAAGPALAEEIPTGSYQHSCNHIALAESTDTLTAKCLESNGKTRFSTKLKDAWACWGDIYNSGGHLRCAIPKGSYQQSCRGAVMMDAAGTYVGGSQLVAQCKNDNGGWRATSLADDACDPDIWGTSDIWNNNGQLGCNPPPTSNTVQSGNDHGGVSGTCWPSC